MSETAIAASLATALAIGPNIALASDNVHWGLELSINDGKVEECRDQGRHLAPPRNTSPDYGIKARR